MRGKGILGEGTWLNAGKAGSAWEVVSRAACWEPGLVDELVTGGIICRDGMDLYFVGGG